MNLAPQFGFFELVLVAIVALIVVGPRDLPKLMRDLGRLAGRARRMASEFRHAFDQMARETEMEEMRREIEALKRANPLADAAREVEAAVRPVEDMARAEMNELQDELATPRLAEAPEKVGLDPATVEGGRAP
jgi:sec-independent protein translocase protein TatB